MGLLTLTDYKRILKQLLPVGRAWNGSVLQNFVESFAAQALRVDSYAYSLHDEVDPRTTEYFISEWEDLTGLPGTLSGTYPTDIAGRRKMVAWKYIATGGQTKDYLINLAYMAGFTITISENVPQDSTASTTNNFIFYVYLIANSLSLSTTILEELIGAAKPAHLSVVFNFDDPYFRAGDTAGERLTEYK